MGSNRSIRNINNHSRKRSRHRRKSVRKIQFTKNIAHESDPLQTAVSRLISTLIHAVNFSKIHLHKPANFK